jgi:hypothetical protein
MAVGNSVTPAQAGRAFAHLVRSEPEARRLWVRAARDYIELWLVTTPMRSDEAPALYEAGLALSDQFADADLRLHVINPSNYPNRDPATIIPPDAEEVPLRPS